MNNKISMYGQIILYSIITSICDNNEQIDLC